MSAVCLQFFLFMQVSSLEMELKTKEETLKATETRLVHLEQDLIEMSLSNDQYRSQVSCNFCIFFDNFLRKLLTF